MQSETVMLNPQTLETDPNGVQYTKTTNENGTVELVLYSEPLPSSLDSVKAVKIAELDAACVGVLQTFQSDALTPGTMATYLSDYQSMALLNGEYAFINGPDYNGTDLVPWFVVGQGYVNHTASQLRKVYTDGRAWFQSQKVKKSQLEAEVNAATNVDAVNAINW